MWGAHEADTRCGPARTERLGDLRRDVLRVPLPGRLGEDLDRLATNAFRVVDRGGETVGHADVGTYKHGRLLALGW